MKYIFFLLMFLPVFCFADDTIQVSISPENISIGQDFEIRIQIQTKDIPPEQISLEIPGIENFDIFSQGQSLNYQDINGQSSAALTYTLQASALKSGTFVLGPVKLKSSTQEIIDDMSSSIVVSQTWVLSTGQEDIPQISWTSEQQITQKDIKGLRTSKDFMWSIITGFGAIFIAMFLLLQYIIKKQSQEITSKEPSEIKALTLDTANLTKEKFELLRKKIGSISSQEFFREYNIILREIFSQDGYPLALTGTLQELKNIQKLESHPLFMIFQKSYTYEYTQREISPETQKKYIEDSISLL